MRPRMVIGQAQLAEIGRLAASSYPDEGCGVLVGTAGEGVIRIDAVLPGRNLRTDRARDRYNSRRGNPVIGAGGKRRPWGSGRSGARVAASDVPISR